MLESRFPDTTVESRTRLGINKRGVFFGLDEDCQLQVSSFHHDLAVFEPSFLMLPPSLDPYPIGLISLFLSLYYNDMQQEGNAHADD